MSEFYGLSGQRTSGPQSIIHTSRVRITYALESVSFLTQITHNQQVTIHLRKKNVNMISSPAMPIVRLGLELKI